MLQSSKVLLLAILALGAAACSQVGAAWDSASTSAKNNLQLEFASQPIWFTEQEIKLSAPEVYIHPVNDVGSVKVLFVPFRVSQIMERSEEAGYSLAKGFWQTWAGMGVFEQMEFLPDAGPFRRDVALKLAKRKGADMVVGGYVTRLLNGGSRSESSLAVQLEAYDVKSGLLVWSMSQAGSIPAQRKSDYIIFSTQTRMPDDAIYSINAAMAQQLGAIMHKWSQGEEAQAGDEKSESGAS